MKVTDRLLIIDLAVLINLLCNELCPSSIVVGVVKETHAAEAVHNVVILGVVAALIRKHGTNGSSAERNTVVGSKEELLELSGDGKITVFDAQILAEAKAGRRELTDEQWKALDDLTPADILDYILGK